MQSGLALQNCLRVDQLLPGATIVARHQLAPELADEIAAARLVVLVDARQDGGRPGDVRIEQVVGSCRPVGSHAVDVSAIVDLAERRLRQRPARCRRQRERRAVRSRRRPVVRRCVETPPRRRRRDRRRRIPHRLARTGTKVPSVRVTGPFAGRRAWRTIKVVGIETSGQRRRWGTPTGDPCPRLVHMDGRVEGTGECQACGFCLLLAGLVEFPAPTSRDLK